MGCVCVYVGRNLGEGRGGKHDPGHAAKHTSRPVYLPNPGELDNPGPIPSPARARRALRGVLSRSFWLLNPRSLSAVSERVGRLF